MNGHMLPRERCDYSAIVDRPPMKLPGGARSHDEARDRQL
jgi:allantoinase